MFGKADPYCKIVIGAQEFSTRPHKVQAVGVVRFARLTDHYSAAGRFVPLDVRCAIKHSIGRGGLHVGNILDARVIFLKYQQRPEISVSLS